MLSKPLRRIAARRAWPVEPCPKPQREPMSKVDTAWLRMEQPRNLMMINGVIGLERGLDYQRLLKTIETAFAGI